MSQYSDGIIFIKEKSRNIINGIDTKFLSNVRRGDLFTIDKSSIIQYTVDTVISDTELILISPYTGMYTNQKLMYSITREFSSLIGFPVTNHNEKAFSANTTLFLRMIDVFMKNLGFKSPDNPFCDDGNE